MALIANVEKESCQIRSRGGARPGAGRPRGSPNKLTRPLKEAAALHTEGCLAVLVFLRDHAESEQVRLAAAMALLDRGHGRPRQEVDISKNEGITVIVDRGLKTIGIPLGSALKGSTPDDAA